MTRNLMRWRETATGHDTTLSAFHLIIFMAHFNLVKHSIHELDLFYRYEMMSVLLPDNKSDFITLYPVTCIFLAKTLSSSYNNSVISRIVHQSGFLWASICEKIKNTHICIIFSSVKKYMLSGQISKRRIENIFVEVEAAVNPLKFIVCSSLRKDLNIFIAACLDIYRQYLTPNQFFYLYLPRHRLLLESKVPKTSSKYFHPNLLMRNLWTSYLWKAMKTF